MHKVGSPSHTVSSNHHASAALPVECLHQHLWHHPALAQGRTPHRVVYRHHAPSGHRGGGDGRYRGSSHGLSPLDFCPISTPKISCILAPFQAYDALGSLSAT